MSKTFIPQFACPGTAPEFTTDGSPPQSLRAICPLEWPSLEVPGRGANADQARKGREEKILKDAREKALALEQEAYEKGFALGEKDGRELGQKKVEAVLESLQQVLGRMDRLLEDLCERHEGEMVRVFFAVTRKILHHDLPLPETVVRKTLQAAFLQVSEARNIVLHLHPKDHQSLLSRPEPTISATSEDSKCVQLLADPAIARGGCLLETAYGEIDATLDSQLDEIIAAVGSGAALAPARGDQPHHDPSP